MLALDRGRYYVYHSTVRSELIPPNWRLTMTTTRYFARRNPDADTSPWECVMAADGCETVVSTHSSMADALWAATMANEARDVVRPVRW